jgi:hypothetical protein
MTVHTPIESPGRVSNTSQTSLVSLFLEMYVVISGQKNPKKRVKKRLFKGSFKKSCFGSKISKK